MGWNTDQPPLNYLKRRIKYYEKKRRQIKNSTNCKMLIERYGKSQLNKMIKQALRNNDKRKKEFEEAVNQLIKQQE